MIKGIVKAYNPAGTFYLPLSNLCYHDFFEDATLLFLLMLFHHMDTVLVFVFVFLNLNLYITTIVHRFHACKSSPVNYVTK